MASSDIFAVEDGFGAQTIEWIKNYSDDNKKKFDVKKENYSITTKNFGNFEAISWKGNWADARNIIVKVSKKLKIKVIESGYREKDNIFLSFLGLSKDYGKVYNKGNFIGIITVRIRSGKIIVKSEKLC